MFRWLTHKPASIRLLQALGHQATLLAEGEAAALARKARARALCSAGLFSSLARSGLEAAGETTSASQQIAVRYSLPKRGGDLPRTFASSASSSSPRNPSTSGPVNYVSLALTMATGAGLLAYYTHTKEKRLAEYRAKEGGQQVAGAALVGGPFELVDTEGRPFSSEDLLGEFALLYYGFTYCPDICPDELEKVAQAVDLVEKRAGSRVQPVFISVDPERDTPQQVKEYVKEFHPRLIGLTGTLEQVKAAARAYRVYYSKTDDSPDDYLVDHSIITYLVDPEGKFVTFYGKNFEAPEMAESISGHVSSWAASHPEYVKGKGGGDSSTKRK